VLFGIIFTLSDLPLFFTFKKGRGNLNTSHDYQNKNDMKTEYKRKRPFAETKANLQ